MLDEFCIRNWYSFSGNLTECCTVLLTATKLLGLIELFWLSIRFPFNESAIKQEFNIRNVYDNSA